MTQARCTHDVLGNLAAILGSSGEPEDYTHDGLCRILSAKNPLEETARFSYDDNGSEASVLAPGGEVAYYAYLDFRQKMEDAETIPRYDGLIPAPPSPRRTRRWKQYLRFWRSLQVLLRR